MKWIGGKIVAAAAVAGPLLAAPLLAQDWAGDPNSVVYALYANYASGKQGMASDDFAQFLTPSTRTLFERALNDTSDANPLNADPFCDCQDFDTIRVEAVLLTMESADAAKATARIADAIDGYKPRSIVIRLRQTPAGWRVDDAGPEDGWSLLKAFETKPKGPANGQ